jgi:predicted nucleic acid-binding protein
MSAIVVVDASALAAIAFREPEARAVLDRLAGRELVAPRLLAYELTNTALTKISRHPAEADAIRTGLTGALSDDLAIYWSDVAHDEVLALAEQTGLTAYDAAYLWLAHYLEADLVTLDTRLQRAFEGR